MPSFFDDDFLNDDPATPKPPATVLGQSSNAAQPAATATSAPTPPATPPAEPKPPVTGGPMAPATPAPTPAPPPKPAGMTVDQRRQRQIDAQRGLGVNWRSDENQDDPVFKAKQVLSQELEGGHFDPLPGTNLFYSWQGGDASSGGRMVFKDANGREVQGSQAQQQAALADMGNWSAAYNESQGLPPGGAGSGGGAFGGSGGGPSFEEQIQAMLAGGMSGANSRYNQDTVRAMRASAAEDSAAQVEGLNRAVNRSAARKGTLYSGSTDAETAANRRAGAQDTARAFRTIDVNKATADFEDKMASADKALALVGQWREERIANARNATDLRRIEAEAKAAADKIKADAAIAQKGYDAERASGAANRAWQDARDERSRDWTREDQAREDAYRLAQMYGG